MLQQMNNAFSSLNHSRRENKAANTTHLQGMAVGLSIFNCSLLNAFKAFCRWKPQSSLLWTLFTLTKTNQNKNKNNKGFCSNPMKLPSCVACSSPTVDSYFLSYFFRSFAATLLDKGNNRLYVGFLSPSCDG